MQWAVKCPILVLFLCFLRNLFRPDQCGEGCRFIGVDGAAVQLQRNYFTKYGDTLAKSPYGPNVL